MTGYPGTPTDWWGQLLAGLAQLAIADSQAMLASLLHSFGAATEPDFSAIGPVYDRMLAIALLLVGAVIAFALIERIAGGKDGAGIFVLARTLAAVFGAYCGLGLVEYLAGYAALLATTWSVDLGTLANRLGALSASGAVNGQSGTSVLGLILTALLLTFLALLVYLELIVRSALVLVLTAFIPFVCVLAIWPRMASAAAHLIEFLVGLLLSKFVVATAVYIGFQLILPTLLNTRAGGPNWMESGIAVLLIAAFSPVALFQGIRFAHSTAGTAARDFGGAVVGMAPFGSVVHAGQRLASHPTVVSGRQRIAGAIVSRIRPGGRA
ncbi:MAG TPA: hypothetical protein VMW11_01865 [Candidatus Dormibacteraeota bacterium]|nr:hypothetical protein [Candidatus Dormibacteraeota bacterium]